jgi:hypothetical protein
VTGNAGRFAGRRYVPGAVAAAASGCLMALMAAGTATASAAGQTVINASLNDVSCTSASNCMAVGWFLGQIKGTSGFQDFTLAETWNGTAWTVTPSPSPTLPGGGELLNSVSCTSSTSCMAVGESLVFSTRIGNLVEHPFAESWNGTAWTVVPTPVLAHSGAGLNGVSCTSPSSCMAVGNEGTPKNPTLFTLAESWNGTAWSFVATPAPLTPGGTALSKVSCTSSPNCMAVGYYGFNNGTGTAVTLAESWNGTTWQRRDTPVPGSDATLAGVSCTAAPACTSVGAHAETSPTLISGTLVQRWDGSHWRTQQSPNPRGAGGAGLGAVSCPGPSACMAAGSAFDPTGESSFNVAEAWNGTTWSLLRTPNPGSVNNELRGISCTSPSRCMAVGDFAGIGNELTLAESWNGTAWTVVKTPHP